ncbi:disease resistance-responsive (dirigent-like protein) family protein [Actinidia rufa]|uniref:Dirigent protein n=1 Tax=Actinidia rufa TaxID=165716 RepID=A0A7J0GVJ1_9ERIC|nr:disease resistance-responsive (dirigent-like protein) family protein [Actinidia rufa]
MKITCYLLLLVVTLECASSARILDEVVPQAPILPADALEASDDVPDEAPMAGPTTSLPSGQIPATTTGATPSVGVAPLSGPTTTLPNGATPIATAAPDDDVPDTVPVPVAVVAPVATPAVTSPSVPSSVPATSATVAEIPPLSFFMHDILGGTHPSGRVVTGIVANSDVNSLPFSKPNSQVLPINGGVPLNSVTGVINNNNAPFLIGLNGSPTSTVIQNNGNNNVVNGGNNLPFVSAGQLPAGLTLQQLMFGSITVVDNELTEGHELGSAVLGSAQGFYLASSLDGTSHTLVLTALFHGGEHHVDDTISFFGVHRTGSPMSQIAVIGGTGKYENAKGYAAIETLHQQDQHTTDGVETITQFNVYLTP